MSGIKETIILLEQPKDLVHLRLDIVLELFEGN